MALHYIELKSLMLFVEHISVNVYNSSCSEIQEKNSKSEQTLMLPLWPLNADGALQFWWAPLKS
jgi:hypothetical protein